MRNTIHDTQIVTPFRNGYVHEDHGRGPPLDEAKKQRGPSWPSC